MFHGIKNWVWRALRVGPEMKRIAPRKWVILRVEELESRECPALIWNATVLDEFGVGLWSVRDNWIDSTTAQKPTVEAFHFDELTELEFTGLTASNRKDSIDDIGLDRRIRSLTVQSYTGTITIGTQGAPKSDLTILQTLVLETGRIRGLGKSATTVTISGNESAFTWKGGSIEDMELNLGSFNFPDLATTIDGANPKIF